LSDVYLLFCSQFTTFTERNKQKHNFLATLFFVYHKNKNQSLMMNKNFQKNNPINSKDDRGDRNLFFASKLPALTPLKRRSREEQIQRFSSRLSSSPIAVDTILVGMKQIKNDPSNQKYRILDKMTKGYCNTLAPVAAAGDLLLAVGFEEQTSQRRDGNYKQMVLTYVDQTLIEKVIKALEAIRTTKSYRMEKKRLQFEKSVRNIISSSGSSGILSKTEKDARLSYSEKTPSDPDNNDNVATVHVRVLPDLTLKRRFHSDDQLRDVLFWLGSIASEIPTKLMNEEWCLVDRIMSDPAPIPCNKAGLNNTLQRIGMWPIGSLELRQNDKCQMIERPFAPRSLGVTASA